MESGVLIIIVIVIVIVIAAVIGLVLWLVMRKDPEDEDEDSTSDSKSSSSSAQSDSSPSPPPSDSSPDPPKDLCANYDKTNYTGCNTIKIGDYIFKSLSFREKKMKEIVANKYFSNKSGGVLNLFVSNSSDQLYTLSSNKITVNNRNSDNFLRAIKETKGGVFFGWGSVPVDQTEFVFYDGSNICFYDATDSQYLYILRDQSGAYVERVETKIYYNGIINGNFKSYIDLVDS